MCPNVMDFASTLHWALGLTPPLSRKYAVVNIKIEIYNWG